ncbi:MAG TPA: polysaccharide biosynthesis protein [Rhodospirillales bacterium]|nr:polysaccharide biosynthesis protein [Rhodospirillales bacterium]
MIFNRANFAFLHDVAMAAAALIVSLFLRLGEDIVFYPRDELYLAIGIFTTVSAVVFRLMKMYQGVWRYASLNDLFNITKASSLTILIFIIILFAVTRLEDLPRSLPIISWFVLIALLGGPRFLYRLLKDRRLDFHLDKDAHLRVPVLLVGSGDSAELFIRDISRTDSNYRVVGIVSDIAARVGRNIHGVKIMGTIDQISAVVQKLANMGAKPQRLIVTSERFQSIKMKELFETADSLGMNIARLPSLSDFQNDLPDDMKIKPIDVEDLLGRPQSTLDKAEVKRLISGKRLLITGAGGSIGRELVRQVSSLEPDHITLVDSSEYNLFCVDMELANQHADLSRQALLGDVRDRIRIKSIFVDQRPDIVFHAAALKHVPLVEANILEGISTNIFGTVNVGDAARSCNVSTFIQISTDKAVNPTSVMGVSKRVAEQYCQALELERSSKDDTNFITVRFGNVLGSTGSVVELFRKQLSDGGPLTVTHPDMTRYFMTTREAVELVLQAAALGIEEEALNGRIFVLDMGEPVRIMDLARQMIRLADLIPDEDIKIVITGIRPGEKLFEEVLHGSEAPVQSNQEGILVASPRTVTLKEVESDLEELRGALTTENLTGVFDLLYKLVPEYKPNNTEAPQSEVV